MTKNALSKYLIIKPYLEQESSLSAISIDNKVAIRTLQRWIAQYKKEGLQNLERKHRSDLGKYRKITNQTKGIIEGLFLDKKNITIANITRKINEYCVEQSTKPTNYYTVRKVVQGIPKDMATLAKYGNKVYADKYEIIMRRESKYSNKMWQVDHCLLSIKVRHKDKAEDYPWLTIVIDDFSRAIMGFCLFIGAPSAIQTALALRKAIWYKQEKNWSVCGIPEILYTDHGTDFTSTHIDYVCADLKIQLIHSIVGKPKGRGKVERFFLSLEQKLIERLKMNNDVQFILTKEYKKFEEFCNSCKDYRYIGLCHGIPGIGKTLSAIKYACWNETSNFYDINFKKMINEPDSLPSFPDILHCDTILMTAAPTNTPSRIDKMISSEAHKLNFMKYFSVNKDYSKYMYYSDQERFSEVKLVMMDEVDHLKYTSLEQLRDIYDRHKFGMVLIGMPGIERRISRYPQLYSRVGFLHEFKALSKDEMTFIIEHHLAQLGTGIKMDNFSDYETLNTIVRIAKGNLRILTRLFQQLERLIKINNITSINTDLVNAAREALVSGS